MRFDAFIGGSYQAAAFSADQEKTVNWYVENILPEGATSRRAFLPFPGVTELTSGIGSGYGRGHFAMDGREFIVMGDWLYEGNANGTLTSRGSLFPGSSPSTNTTPATIHSNGDGGGQLFITLKAADDYGFYFDLGVGISATRISALDGKATMGDYLDGYFLALDADSSTLYISNLFDGATWSTGTDFAQRSLAADPWVSMKVAGRYVWMFGEQTTEIWQDTGATFPFAPIPNALIQEGIAAPWSPAVIGDSVIWLARNENGRISVQQAGGVSPRPISTPALEYLISNYSDIADAVGDAWSWEGHDFYELSFDTTGITHVWDATTGLWFDKQSWNSATGEYTAWRPRYHAYAFGEPRVLDSRGSYLGYLPGSGLYKLDAAISTDIDGAPIRRMRRTPALNNENKRVFYSELELDLDKGLGTSGQAEDPQAMLRISNDGGKTWGPEIWRSAGKTGEFGKRVRWNRLGSGRKRVFEVVVTDPIAWRVTDSYLSIMSQGKVA